MSVDLYCVMVFLLFASIIGGMLMICFDDSPDGLAFFNPIRNYKTWTSMNWFGVIFVTLMLHVILPAYAIGYWFYKLCTVGRK